MRSCQASACGLRFPAPQDYALTHGCPLCDAPTRLVGSYSPEVPAPSPHVIRPLAAVIDNVRSAGNVGTILRSADGAGFEVVHLCGISPRGDNPKVHKTSLGAQDSVRWEHHANACNAVAALQREGWEVWAVESSPDAVALFDADVRTECPVAIVVGNEVAGVDPDVLALADRHCVLPMHGMKGSLNVAVAFGIAAYWLRSIDG